MSDNILDSNITYTLKKAIRTMPPGEIRELSKFEKDIEIGEQHAKELEMYFRRIGYKCFDVRRLIDLFGIDRILEDTKTGEQTGVQFKADKKAHETDNFFLEVETGKASGWTLTMLAQVIVLYVPGKNTAFEIDFMRLRRGMRRWKDIYPLKDHICPETGYRAKGLCVPGKLVVNECKAILHTPIIPTEML